MPDAAHVFLSYNSRDRDKVRRVHRFLSERGISTDVALQKNGFADMGWAEGLSSW